MPEIFPHTSLRRSPYYEATMAEGATTFEEVVRLLAKGLYEGRRPGQDANV